MIRMIKLNPAGHPTGRVLDLKALPDATSATGFAHVSQRGGKRVDKADRDADDELLVCFTNDPILTLLVKDQGGDFTLPTFDATMPDGSKWAFTTIPRIDMPGDPPLRECECADVARQNGEKPGKPSNSTGRPGDRPGPPGE